MSTPWSASGYATAVTRLGDTLGMLKACEDFLDLEVGERSTTNSWEQRNCDVIYLMGPNNGVRRGFCSRNTGYVTADARQYWQQSVLEPAIDQVYDAAMSWGRDVAESVAELDRPVTYPLVSYADVAAAAYQDVVGDATDAANGVFVEVRSRVDDWTGGAAESFRNYVDGVLEASLENQETCASNLAAILAGISASYKMTRHSLMATVETMQAAADSQIARLESLDDGGAAQNRTVLQVLSTLTSFVSAVPHPAVAVSAGVLSTLLELGADSIPEQDLDAPVAVTAQTATALAAQVEDFAREAASRNDRRITHLEIDYLRELESKVAWWIDSGRFRPEPPGLAHGETSPSDFGPPAA